jgi:hypothetical protein
MFFAPDIYTYGFESCYDSNIKFTLSASTANLFATNQVFYVETPSYTGCSTCVQITDPLAPIYLYSSIILVGYIDCDDCFNSFPAPTPTPTPTKTSTPTPSVTPTLTKTPTRTPTQTPTQTKTQTPTPSVTPTFTPTNTQTTTNTPTNTQTPTNTSTVTASPVTPTPTPTPSVTPTNYPTSALIGVQERPTGKSECDVITILPLDAECNVSYTLQQFTPQIATANVTLSLDITGGTQPYTTVWYSQTNDGIEPPTGNSFNFSVSISPTTNYYIPFTAITTDYYGDFTIQTVCVFEYLAPTPTPTPTPTSTPIVDPPIICMRLNSENPEVLNSYSLDFTYQGILNGYPYYVCNSNSFANGWIISANTGYTPTRYVFVDPTEPINGVGSSGEIPIQSSANIPNNTYFPLSVDSLNPVVGIWSPIVINSTIYYSVEVSNGPCGRISVTPPPVTSPPTSPPPTNVNRFLFRKCDTTNNTFLSQPFDTEYDITELTQDFNYGFSSYPIFNPVSSNVPFENQGSPGLNKSFAYYNGIEWECWIYSGEFVSDANLINYVQTNFPGSSISSITYNYFYNPLPAGSGYTTTRIDSPLTSVTLVNPKPPVGSPDPFYTYEFGYQNCGECSSSISTNTGDEGRLLSSVIKQQPECGCDGSITMISYLGTPPYQYSIDGGINYSYTPIFNNLCNNTYLVEIKDLNGLTYNETVYLSSPTNTGNYTITLTSSISTIEDGYDTNGNRVQTKKIDWGINVTPSLGQYENLVITLQHQNKEVKSPYNQILDISPVSSTTSSNLFLSNLYYSATPNTTITAITTSTQIGCLPTTNYTSPQNVLTTISSEYWSIIMNSSDVLIGSVISTIKYDPTQFTSYCIVANLEDTIQITNSYIVGNTCGSNVSIPNIATMNNNIGAPPQQTTIQS